MSTLSISQESRSSYLPILILIVALCFLASGGIFVRLSELGPTATAFYRALFAIPFALIWLAMEKGGNHLPMTAIHKPHLIVMMAGVFLALDLVLWHQAFYLTTVANANLLANLMPFILIPLNFLVFKVKPSKLFIYGLVISSFGLALLIGGKAEITSRFLMGDFFALATAFFYALYFFTMGKLREQYSASSLMLWSTIGCFITLIPCTILLNESFVIPNLEAILVLVMLAFFAHIGGQGLLAQALGKVTLNLSSVLVLLQPIIAAVYAFFIFDEYLTSMELVGAFTILAGIYLSKKGS